MSPSLSLVWNVGSCECKARLAKPPPGDLWIFGCVNVTIDASAHTDVFPPTLGGVAPAVALRVVRQGQQVDAGGASARAKDSDAQRVTTEGRNVLAGPAQSLDQVQQAVVALGCLVTSAQEACERRTREGGGETGKRTGAET